MATIVSSRPLLKDLTLYHYPGTRSARVLWLLYELGPAVTGPLTVKRVELLEGEGRAEWCVCAPACTARPAPLCLRCHGYDALVACMLESPCRAPGFSRSTPTTECQR